MISKLSVFKNTADKTEKEPALMVGASVTSVAGVLSLIGYLVPNFISDGAMDKIVIIAAFVLPIITAIFTRGKVWSIASVQQVIDEAVTEAMKQKELKNRDPDLPM